MKHTAITTSAHGPLIGPGGPLEQKVTRVIHTLIWHCTATPEGRKVSVATVDGWHRDRGWSGIGYHLVVHLDGSVGKGRDMNRVGAHVKGANTGSVGFTYVGGLDSRGDPKDTRTEAQKATMLKLTEEAIEFYGVKTVKGHRDFSPDRDGDGVIEPFEYIKACPCFDAIPEYAHLVSGTAAPAGSGGQTEVGVGTGLRAGAAGDDVIRLQELLGLSPTGVFDKLTARAVREAKKKIGLYPSDIVVPYVMKALEEAREAGRLAA